MASMRDIKRRKSSIQSTQQITKAMKLVSTVKLQRTREKAEECNPYFNHMYATVTSMLARTGIVEHPYLKSGKSGKKGVIVNLIQQRTGRRLQLQHRENAHAGRTGRKRASDL